MKCKPYHLVPLWFYNNVLQLAWQTMLKEDQPKSYVRGKPVLRCSVYWSSARYKPVMRQRVRATVFCPHDRVGYRIKVRPSRPPRSRKAVPWWIEQVVTDFAHELAHVAHHQRRLSDSRSRTPYKQRVEEIRAREAEVVCRQTLLCNRSFRRAFDRLCILAAQRLR